MRSRLVTRGWVLAALLGVLVLLVGSARPWLHARADDAVVGVASLTVTGSDLSPAVPAAALLASAALLAGLVGSPVVRRLAGGCLLLAAVVAGVPVVGAVRDPAAAAEPALAERTAITGAAEGSLQVQAEVTWVVYAALIGVLALVVAGVLRLLPAPAPAKPGTALEADPHATATTGRPGTTDPRGGTDRETDGPGAGGSARQSEGYGSAAWEQLSAGQDPTAEADDPGTRDRNDRDG